MRHAGALMQTVSPARRFEQSLWRARLGLNRKKFDKVRLFRAPETIEVQVSPASTVIVSHWPGSLLGDGQFSDA